MAKFGVNMMFFGCHRTVSALKELKICQFSIFNEVKII